QRQDERRHEQPGEHASLLPGWPRVEGRGRRQHTAGAGGKPAPAASAACAGRRRRVHLARSYLIEQPRPRVSVVLTDSPFSAASMASSTYFSLTRAAFWLSSS